MAGGSTASFDHQTSVNETARRGVLEQLKSYLDKATAGRSGDTLVIFGSQKWQKAAAGEVFKGATFCKDAYGLQGRVRSMGFRLVFARESRISLRKDLFR